MTARTGSRVHFVMSAGPLGTDLLVFHGISREATCFADTKRMWERAMESLRVLLSTGAARARRAAPADVRPSSGRGDAVPAAAPEQDLDDANNALLEEARRKRVELSRFEREQVAYLAGESPSQQPAGLPRSQPRRVGKDSEGRAVLVVIGARIPPLDEAVRRLAFGAVGRGDARARWQRLYALMMYVALLLDEVARFPQGGRRRCRRLGAHASPNARLLAAVGCQASSLCTATRTPSSRGASSRGSAPCATACRACSARISLRCTSFTLPSSSR
jgi:hypothetical protein